MYLAQVVAAALIGSAPALAIAQPPEAPFDAPEHREFDFWVGEWRSSWFSPDDEALDGFSPDIEMRHRVFPILGGKALIELAEPFDREAAAGPGLRGFSIRYRDGRSGGWTMAQHWPSPGNAGVAFTDQLTGPGMEHGRLTVYQVFPLSPPDATAYQRYTFSDIGPGRFRWDGAVSEGFGAGWRVNLMMHFNQIDPVPQARAAGEDWFGQAGGQTCAGPIHDAFDGLVGRWTGRVSYADGRAPQHATFEAGEMLDGCAVAGFLSVDGQERFMAWSYSPRFQRWVAFSLSDALGEPHVYQLAESGGEGAVFEPSPGLTIQSPTARYYGVQSPPALSRTVWRRLQPNVIEIERQIRSGEDAEWVVDAVLALGPASP